MEQDCLPPPSFFLLLSPPVSLLMHPLSSFHNDQDDAEKNAPPLPKQTTPAPIHTQPPAQRIESLSMLEQLKLKAQ